MPLRRCVTAMHEEVVSGSVQDLEAAHRVVPWAMPPVGALRDTKLSLIDTPSRSQLIRSAGRTNGCFRLAWSRSGCRKKSPSVTGVLGPLRTSSGFRQSLCHTSLQFPQCHFDWKTRQCRAFRIVQSQLPDKPNPSNADKRRQSAQCALFGDRRRRWDGFC